MLGQKLQMGQRLFSFLLLKKNIDTQQLSQFKGHWC